MHGLNAICTWGKEYWQKRGFMKKLNWYHIVSLNPKINKKTKRITHKRERQEIKTLLNNNPEVF